MKKTNTPENIIALLKSLKDDGVNEKEYNRHVKKMLEFKARKCGIPLHGSFELTPLCNFDCKMCYVHLDNSKFNSNNLLSVENWKWIIKQAHEAGMLRATLTGGECLTYPGFEDVYLYLHEIGISPAVLSNGLLMDKRQIDFFKRYYPRLIQVSLYGSSDDVYEAVTGHRVFDKVYENIVALKEASLPVAIAITPSKYMKDDFRKLLEKVEALNIPYNINSSLKPPRKNTGRIEEDLTTDQYIDLYKIRSEIRNKTLETIDPTELPDENRAYKRVYGLRCGAGRSAFAIKYDGRICPCFSLYEIDADPFVMGFHSAWNEINTQVNNYLIPQECNGCVYYNYCLTCPALHTKAPIEGHCDPRVCERTKKFVSVGLVPLPKES